MAKAKKADLLTRVLGRPKGPPTSYLPLRVPPEVKATLERDAKKAGVPLNKYMQSLLAAKANGAPNPDAIEEERGHSAQREIKRELQSSVASAADIRGRLDGLRRLCRGMLADAERALRAGRYSFWRGEPDEETKKNIAALELEIAACSKSVSEARAAILAARPGKDPGGKTLWDSIVGEKQ